MRGTSRPRPARSRRAPRPRSSSAAGRHGTGRNRGRRWCGCASRAACGARDGARPARRSAAASPRAIRGPSGCRPPRARRARRPTAARRRCRGRTAGRPGEAEVLVERQRRDHREIEQQVGLVMDVVGRGSRREPVRRITWRCQASSASVATMAMHRNHDALLRRLGAPASTSRSTARKAMPRGRERDQDHLEHRRQRLGLAVAEAVILVGRHAPRPTLRPASRGWRPGRARYRPGCRASRSSRCARPPSL